MIKIKINSHVDVAALIKQFEFHCVLIVKYSVKYLNSKHDYDYVNDFTKTCSCRT